MTFVLLSLVVFVLETHPTFKEKLTIEDYAEYYDVTLEELIEAWEGELPPGTPRYLVSTEGNGYHCVL